MHMFHRVYQAAALVRLLFGQVRQMAAPGDEVAVSDCFLTGFVRFIDQIRCIFGTHCVGHYKLRLNSLQKI